MAKSINKAREIDVAAVCGNKTLAVGVDRRAVERCKDAIEKYGVMHTPVVGATKDGKRMLLSGQCGLTALRELGIKKVEAIEIEAAEDAGANAKLSLLLTFLWDRPGALCEGELLREAVAAGVSRQEIQAMLGKSASWVSNRIALVTRLDAGVYGMVRAGLLDPRSAQEIARLPAEAQFVFADKAVREGLPKSVIESLVSGYNDESCPDLVKKQILNDPRAALKRMMDRRRAVKARNKGSIPDERDAYIRSVRLLATGLCRLLEKRLPFENEEYRDALKAPLAGLLALLMKIKGLISPGKMEEGQNAG